jgi:hypothetical protein
MSYSEQLSRPHVTPEQAQGPTPEQTPQQASASESMGFAALLGWGLVALIMGMVLFGLVK